MGTLEQDNIRKAASRMESDSFDRKMDQHFKSHPELKSGRDFRANTMRFQVPTEEIGDKFDDTFPDAPSGPAWWKDKYCEGCDRVYSQCRC